MQKKRALFILPILFWLIGAAGSSTLAAGGPGGPAAAEADVAPAVNNPGPAAPKPADEYQASLQELAKIQERDIKRLAEQNAAMQELVKEGLASRRELEQSDRDLAAARSRADEIQKQIASAEAARQESLRPKSAPEVIAAGNAGVNWTTGNKQIDALINHYGAQHGVDPYLVYCVMRQESSFSLGATSPKGAQGLMQLMPATAARYGVTDPYDPAQSIRGGIRYLKFLLDKFDGNVSLALAGYNAGEGAVMKYGNRIPPYRETQEYVRNISTRYLSAGTKPRSDS